MRAYVLGFQEIDKTKLPLVGGKGANLGELAKLEGIRVPAGFCISTEAYQRIIGTSSAINELLAQLAQLKGEDQGQIRELSAALRRLIEGTTIPEEIQAAVVHQLARLGANAAYAVRSSATAEDLPTASFAGQQDTYLNVMGQEAILKQISRCWASLFTERAITYRLQQGFDHRKVSLAVVVQKMLFPQVAGILFTADPITGNRLVVSIDASFGLGEALVSGLVNADTYRVRNGKIIEKQISTKQLAMGAANAGGTQVQAIAPEQQNSQALTDAQIVQLAQIGRTIEAHFGQPQDIEWCLVDETFSIVQSRPITTLYPIPDAKDGVENVHSEQEKRVYISVGHQQMMTDAMKPLGLSLWQLTAGRPMYPAGGRLFVDVTQQLAAPASRAMLLGMMGQHDPLMQDALMTLIARGDWLPVLPADPPTSGPAQSQLGGASDHFQALIANDPTIVTELVQRSQRALAVLQQTIPTKTGTDLFDFLLEDLQQLKQSLADPQSMGVIMTALNASAWLNEKMAAWVGEKNIADTLSQAAPNNITSAMGLALLDVADVIRPYPAVIAYLHQANDETFGDDLVTLPGGQAARDAITAYLDQYGMRGVGEIDITRPRWREKPTSLVPLLLGNLKNFAPQASQQKFAQGQQAAQQKEADLLARLAQLPDGEQKVAETKRVISLLRNFIGYREYPKYSIVSRSFVYKQALLKEAERLVQANVIREKEDIYYLTFAELHAVVRTHQLDAQLIRQRKEEYKRNEKLTPPRVITSAGEIITGTYKRANLPANAIVGLPVSAGVIEGRARVILNMEEADLAEGDILVTTFTDPSWTPLFVAIKGLVTEVGGLMTHGAVIAREYGLPAVVGVENATQRIKDGQPIRVHGTEGYVEILA
ncbi:MAG: phosphoenolpyruvate synthase [Caldilineaceae bacterium]|nr:phosphoenolpyruvate synthase [Caldilineaceae bacterium]